MIELSEVNSSKTVPTRLVAITDGAFDGLMETERICPTSSSWGTETLRNPMITTQPMMIGRASVRTHLAMPPRCWGSATGIASVRGSLRSLMRS